MNVLSGAGPELSLKGDPKANVEDLEKKSKALIDEFLREHSIFTISVLLHNFAVFRCTVWLCASVGF